MIRGILLAGGAAVRFGSPKLLHTLPGGQQVGTQAAANLLAGVGNVLAVVRPGADELQTALSATGCKVLVSPQALEGMGASLAAAVAASADAQGWIVALADMPYVRVASIRQVHDALQGGASIVVPVMAGRRGHPVGFAAQWRTALSALQGDEGARGLLREYSQQVREVIVDDPGIHADIDLPSDLQRPA